MKKLGQRGRSDKSEFFSVVAGGDNQMFSWRELEKLHQRKGRLKRQKRTENEREIHQCVIECGGNDILKKGYEKKK